MTDETPKNDINSKLLANPVIIALILVVLGLVIYIALTQPDRRTPGQKIGDAIDAFSDGTDKAARQLKDRTPADKINDAIKDITDDGKKDPD